MVWVTKSQGSWGVNGQSFDPGAEDIVTFDYLLFMSGMHSLHVFCCLWQYSIQLEEMGRTVAWHSPVANLQGGVSPAPGNAADLNTDT